MKYSYILVRVFAPVINSLVALVNIFIRRDKKIVLFGSWMGNRYADNPRFFFQYINDHLDEYKIKKAIWVTRNIEVYDLLKKMGCEVYMMHSRKSYYYHLKAGVHVMCNISFPVKGIDGDIMGFLSGKAIKINMLHGIAIKAGKSTGANNKTRGMIGRLKYFLRNNRLFCAIFTPGHWDRAYLLSSGKECTRRNVLFYGVDEKWFIETGFPRNNTELKTIEAEQKVIDMISSSKYSVLYVPTFRENGKVPHPLNDVELKDYFLKHGYLWVEKPHPASKEELQLNDLGKQVLMLDPDLDINVVLPHISLLITDYSSVSYDAIAVDTPVLYYAADYDHYLKKERGFLCDYEALTRGFVAKNTAELIELIDRAFNDQEYREKLEEKVRAEKSTIFSSHSDMYGIAEKLYKRLGVFERDQL